MCHHNNESMNLKAIEKGLFQRLQEYFHEAFLKLLEEIDHWVMENRDFERYKYTEKQASTIDTVFGPVTVKRRKYKDRVKGKRVALLDQFLEFKGNDSLSPYLAETAVDWAVRGPSYRDARDRLQELLGYQAMSHEKIRQQVLQVQEVDHTVEEDHRRKVNTLFLEVDGIHTPLQQEKKGSREVKVGIVHEGWEPRHPKSKEYVLQNKSYFYTLENGEYFWDTFSRQLYEQYDIDETTHVVINGDGAPWIRAGVEYFPQAIYNYDRYHLKKWIKTALGQRTKQERKKAYDAANDNDPVALLAAIAEAQKAETDDKKKDDIAGLRIFILDNQEAFRNYCERLREKGVDTEGMRPMGSAESNMNFFSRRLKKMGYSWSVNGLEAMVKAIVHRFDGTLAEALNQRPIHNTENGKRPPEKVSLQKLLKQKMRESVGAVMGEMPVLKGREPGSYTAQALRGLAGLQNGL